MSSIVFRKKFTKQLILINLFIAISLLGVGSSLLPLLSFLYSNRKSFLLFLFTSELLVVNCLTFILFLFSQTNQDELILWHVFLSSLLLCLIFANWGKGVVMIRRLSLLTSIIILTLFILIQSTNFWNSNAALSLYSSILNVVLSILAIVSIVISYQSSQHYSLFNDKLFLLSAATLIYYGLQLYVISYESIIRSKVNDLFFITWPIIQFSTIFYHLILAKSIWKLKS